MRVCSVNEDYTFVFQNATVIVKYSWGVFRALSQMIALSYGSMDAPTSEQL